jgi:hypothetical protein
MIQLWGSCSSKILPLVPDPAISHLLPTDVEDFSDGAVVKPFNLLLFLVESFQDSQPHRVVFITKEV